MSPRLGLQNDLIGSSPAFERVVEATLRLARRPVTVLIEGETGTGKEELARLLHYEGDRAAGPFVAVNCGAIPDSLFERELFGHVRGAFTDAHEAGEGLVTHADGGTLFLDEIEALSPKGQVTLLRLLQNFEVRPVGSTKTHEVDVRVVVATNESLERRIEEAQFRQDLYYRIGVVTIRLPPLRERDRDVLDLAEHFAAEYASSYGLPHKPMTEELRVYLLQHSWPGNVRELENAMNRATLLAEGAAQLDLIHVLEVGIADPDEEPLPPLAEAKQRVSEAFERRYMETILREALGNVSLAARRAGKDRSAFRKLMKKHHLDRESFSSMREG